MGHAPNILRNPRALAQLEARLRSESLAGWRRLKSGGLERVNTVSGCLARGAVVVGRCTKLDGCRRRVELDLGFLRNHGFGHMEIHAVTQQFMCARMGGCQLRFEQPRYPDGLPLFELAGPPDHLLQFRCQGCTSEGYRTSAAALLARLVRHDREDAQRIGLAALARRLKQTCSQCGGELWSVTAEAIPVSTAALSLSPSELEGDAAEPVLPARRGFDFRR